MSDDANSVFGSDESPRWGHTLHQAQIRNADSGHSRHYFEHHTATYPTQTQSTQAVPPAAYSAEGNTVLSQVDTKTNPPFQAPILSQSSIQQAGSWPATPPVQGMPGSTFEAFFHAVQRQIQSTLADQVTPVRLAGHFSVLTVATFILVLSQIDVPDWDISLRTLPVATLEGAAPLTNGSAPQVTQMLAGENLDAPFAGASLQRAIVPFTIIPEEPQEGIQTYVVQPGDTVLGIAQKFGLKPESIQWANADLELNPDLLRVGDQLSILPIDGALHTVKVGDTLSSIATKYKVSIEEIINYGPNNISDPSAALIVGTQLIVPGGVKPYVPPQVFAYEGSAPTSATKGTGAFVWPTSGSVTQRFWSGHPAIDVSSWTGAPVKAADSGHVVLATTGWNNGYGNHVIIDHGNGFVSLYAHLNSFYVRVGENVTRGQQIGTVGNTGNSTGPHLHLEIRYQGVPRNPFSYLN